MNKSIVVYHKNCLDGFGAAFAAWKSGKVKEVIFCALDYSDRDSWMREWLPKLELNAYDLYILDFSFSKDHTSQLIDLCNKFVWLDHHKSAFEEHGLLEYFNNGEYYIGGDETNTILLSPNLNSGAYLAWEYFHQEAHVPPFIKFIDDRDRWKFLIPNTKEFCLALSQLPQDFRIWNESVWDWYDLVEKGLVIQEYYDTQLERSVAATKEYCNILGNEGLCCNLPPLFASEAGNLLAKKSGTFGATWYKDSKGNIKWSLRSIGDYDVAAIARQFGGGGHTNAAGFTLTPDSGETISGVKLWHTNTSN